jgi:hypothetical protein
MMRIANYCRSLKGIDPTLSFDFDALNLDVGWGATHLKGSAPSYISHSAVSSGSSDPKPASRIMAAFW